MGSFDVIMSPNAIRQLQSYLDYINWVLLNEQAAEAVFTDAQETLDSLKTNAKMFAYCAHPLLRIDGYRIIRFSHHKYLMLYRIQDTTVMVDAIYHELQDFENLFLSESGEC